MNHKINIVITNDILQIKELTFIEKGILCEIHNLERIGKKCFASNKHFSEIFGISERSVTRCIKNIENTKLIKCEYLSRTDRQIVSQKKFMIDKNANMIDKLSLSDRQIGELDIQLDKQEINREINFEVRENVRKMMREKGIIKKI